MKVTIIPLLTITLLKSISCQSISCRSHMEVRRDYNEKFGFLQVPNPGGSQIIVKLVSAIPVQLTGVSEN